MSRYTPDERIQWHFLPAVANVSGPTEAEFAAGTEITCPIATVNGFTFTANNVDTPDYCSRFTSSIPGRLTVEAGGFEFYAGDAAGDAEVTVKALLPMDATGFIARTMPVNGAKAAIANGTDTEIWPVTVTSNGYANTAPGEAQKFNVQFSHPSPPALDAVIGAS